MANHVKAFTYKPKIQSVLEGIIKQTIRPLGNKPVEESDTILFHGWEGRPYHSSWTWRMKVLVSNVQEIEIFQEGIIWMGNFFYWKHLSHLAIKDGIEKLNGMNHGESMGHYLKTNYKLQSRSEDNEGMKGQIIRWKEYDVLTKGDEVNE